MFSKIFPTIPIIHSCIFCWWCSLSAQSSMYTSYHSCSCLNLFLKHSEPSAIPPVSFLKMSLEVLGDDLLWTGYPLCQLHSCHLEISIDTYLGSPLALQFMHPKASSFFHSCVLVVNMPWKHLKKGTWERKKL